VLQAVGGSKDALAEAQKALALRDDAPRRFFLGVMTLGPDRIQETKTHAETALKLDPTFWPAHMLLATLLPPGDEEGYKHLEAALKLEQDDPSLLTVKANYLLAKRQEKEAIPVLLKALAHGAPPNTQLMLYEAYARLGDTQALEELREKLLAPGPNRSRMEQALKDLDALIEEQKQEAEPPSAPPAAPKLPKLKLPDVSLGGKTPGR